MAITFVAAGTAYAPAANSQTGTVTTPGGIQVGDLLILHLAGSITAVPTLAGPSWTVLEPNLAIGSPGPFHSTWYRWADAADVAGSVTTVTISNSTNIFSGYIVALRGVDTTTPEDVTTPAGTQSATAAVVTAPAITTATAGAWVLTFAAEVAASGSTANDWSSSNMVERAESKSTRTGTNPHLALYTSPVASPGTFTPAVTLAAGTSTRSSILTVALRPAATTPPPTGTQALRIGALTPSDIRLGSAAVSRVFIGSTLVWGAAYTPPSGSTTALTATPWDSHVGTPTSLAEEATYLADLDAATDRVRIVTLGSSAQGRTIRAAIVGPPRSQAQIQAANTALIIGSHHGDEWAGREALFEFMRAHAAGTGTETYVWIPTLNPDGFSIPQRNLANSSDPNRLWSQTGVNQQSSGGAYFPEQQCLRQALLLWRPKIVFDTHEYTSSGVTYRFDPGTTNAAGTPQAVIDIDTAVLAAMKSAATSAGYATADYSGAIPDDGMTQAIKFGGVPGVFTESPQESSAGLTGRRAMQLSSLNAFRTYVQNNASALAAQASAATWYGSNTATVTDAYTP